MNYYILVYKTIDNYLQERPKYRMEHLNLVTESFNNGELILGGAMDNPADEALLIFKGESEDIAKSFALNDPYLKNGLVKKWYVRKWNVVIGND